MFEGGPGSQDPQRISFTRATLQDLLSLAYDLDNEEQIAGPRWLDSDQYDVIATIAPGTNQEQFHKMLRNLLVERFKLALHRETKEAPVYVLVIARNGPKLNGAAQGQRGYPELAPDRPDMVMAMDGARARLAAHQQTMAGLIGLIRRHVDRPIIDQTGLTGKYDFHIEFGLVENADDGEPRIFEALQDQLGLRLEPRKAPIDVLMIDRAERMPSEN